jgi:hypothetical protein
VLGLVIFRQGSALPQKEKRGSSHPRTKTEPKELIKSPHFEGVMKKNHHFSTTVFSNQNQHTMSVVKVIEIMAESKKSWEDAAQIGISKAAESLKHIRSAWVQDQSVTVDSKGKITSYRVSLKLSFEVQ